jgi:hypothetical protein
MRRRLSPSSSANTPLNGLDCCSGVGTGGVLVLVPVLELSCGADAIAGAALRLTRSARLRQMARDTAALPWPGSCRSGAVPPATQRQGPLYGVHVCVSLAPKRASPAAAQQAAQAQDSLLILLSIWWVLWVIAVMDPSNSLARLPFPCPSRRSQGARCFCSEGMCNVQWRAAAYARLWLLSRFL